MLRRTDEHHDNKSLAATIAAALTTAAWLYAIALVGILFSIAATARLACSIITSRAVSKRHGALPALHGKTYAGTYGRRRAGRPVGPER